jgi:hypothetical protein
MNAGSVFERVDVFGYAILIDVHEQVEAEIASHGIAEFDHLAEFPCRIDMEKWKRRFGRIECLHRQSKHDRRILADRIEHYRLGEGCRYLAEDMYRLGFEPLQVG